MLVLPVHSGLQVAEPQPAALKAATPLYALTYTFPPDTAGADPPVTPKTAVPVHSGLQVAAPQPAARNAYSFPSAAVVYTTPPATAGEVTAWAGMVPVHIGLQVTGLPEQPVPAALKARRPLNCVPT